MRLASVASGSSGNCVYVGSDHTHLLIDVGISKKRIEEGLRSKQVDLKDIDGILISHEHSDHIAGLGVVLRKYDIPVYATRGTLNAVKRYKNIGKVDFDLFHPIEADKTFEINDIKVKPFHVSHDACEPVAYRVENEGKSVAVVTDLGYYTDYTVEMLRGIDALLIEANHDIRMLQIGSYPYYLKQRILSNIGHLSNEMTGRLLNELLHDDLKQIYLGHLSRENNYAELAYETVRAEIALSDNRYKADDFPIHIANRETVSDLVEV